MYLISKQISRKVLSLFGIFFLFGFVSNVYAVTPTEHITDTAFAIVDLVQDYLIPIMFLLAILFFFYNIALFMMPGGSRQLENKKFLIWSIIAIFVLVSIWGILTLLRGVLGIDVFRSNGFFNTNTNTYDPFPNQ